MSLERYLDEGVKFCALGMDLAIDDSIYPTCFLNGCEIAPGPFFELPDPWKEWIGSIKYEELSSCNLIILKRVISGMPTVLDVEAREIEKTINRMYVGLMLVSPFALFNRPIMLGGGYQNQMVSVRTQGDLDPPVASLVHMYPTLTLHDFKNATQLEIALRQNFDPIDRADKWVFNRCLDIYVKARTIGDIFDRIHQFSRVIEGLLDAEAGKSKKRFRGRTETFLGPGYHDLMGEIYDVRGSVEHVRSHKYLDIGDRNTRLRIAELEAISEHIARNVLRRILVRPSLHPYFFYKHNIKEFWNLNESERSNLWGTKLNPTNCVLEFDRNIISDEDLGLR